MNDDVYGDAVISSAVSPLPAGVKSRNIVAPLSVFVDSVNYTRRVALVSINSVKYTRRVAICCPPF